MKLRTIAATTWAEYKKYFEKDAALSRRFQVIKIEEPDETQALLMMMRAICPLFEQHHNVTVSDDALVDAVRLSMRYISGRKLPDKSVSVLDTACAQVAMGANAMAPSIEAAQRQIERIAQEVERLMDEQLIGRDHAERIATLEVEREQAETELKRLEERWQMEKDLVDQIQQLRTKLRLWAKEAKPRRQAADKKPCSKWRVN